MYHFKICSDKANLKLRSKRSLSRIQRTEITVTIRKLQCGEREGEVKTDSLMELDNSNIDSTVRTVTTTSSTTVSTVITTTNAPNTNTGLASSSAATQVTLSRYENQKRRDWNTFGQYLCNHRPPLSLPRCSGAHVLEFLRYLDQFGKTKVHIQMCPFFGHPNPPAPCPCPLRQAWGSLDALIGRLRAAFEENGGKPEANPFGARAVRLYLREVRDMQAKARGVSYLKKRRKRPGAPTGLPSSSPALLPPHPPGSSQ